jgi:hypothetical protein
MDQVCFIGSNLGVSVEDFDVAWRLHNTPDCP